MADTESAWHVPASESMYRQVGSDPRIEILGESDGRIECRTRDIETVWVMDASGAIAGYRGQTHAYETVDDGRIGAVCGHLLADRTLLTREDTDAYRLPVTDADRIDCAGCRNAVSETQP